MLTPAIPTKNIVFFDLETQKSAEEVGGWHNIRNMRMSVGVTYSTRDGEYKIYHEDRVKDLISELRRADLVVGFNNLRFDYEVLTAYDVFFDPTNIPTLDLLIELQKIVNHRVSLDAVATTTLGVEKTSEGLQAIYWFREGKLMDIAEYCCYDVKITKMLYEFAASNKSLFFRNRMGQTVRVPLSF